MELFSNLDPYVLFWLILMVIFIIAELATVSLLTIWFAAGSVVAGICAALQCPFLFQLFVFLIVSAICLYLTKPLVKKYVRQKKVDTNADRYVGSHAIVTETVDNLNQSGRADVLGQDWSIRAENDMDIIEAGTRVEVLRIEGAKLIVKRV